MSQTILEMAKDLVTEQILEKRVSAEEMMPLLQRTHSTLKHLHHVEMTGSAATSQEGPAPVLADWKASIQKHAVTCMECGDTFKQLSLRHLSKHDLDPLSYRVKYGIPRTQPLAARANTAHRRALAQRIRPWEQAASKRVAGQATANRGGKH